MGRGSRGVIAWVLALAAAMALAPSSFAASSPPLNVQEQQLFDAMNAYRASLGLKAFVLVPALNRTAQWYAGDMAENDSFSHTHIDSVGRTTQQRYLDFGYRWTYPIGEASLAGIPTADGTLAAWQASPGHDEILRDKKMIAVGVGYAENPVTNGRWFWVASFGSVIPSSKAAKPKHKPKSQSGSDDGETVVIAARRHHRHRTHHRRHRAHHARHRHR